MEAHNATAASLTLVVLQPLGRWPLSIVSLLVISLVGNTPDLEKTAELTWERRYWKEETETFAGTPVLANYRVPTGVMLVVTAGLVVWFR